MNFFLCLLDNADQAPLVNIDIEHLRWPGKSLILRRSGTQFVAMVTEILGSYCGSPLVESSAKNKKIMI